jgi:hypothetical protein
LLKEVHDSYRKDDFDPSYSYRQIIPDLERTKGCISQRGFAVNEIRRSRGKGPKSRKLKLAVVAAYAIHRFTDATHFDYCVIAFVVTPTV